MARAVKVRILLTGVREILHSPGVYEMLGSQAKKAAARCNAMCDPELKKGGARYETTPVSRGYTAGGLVYIGGADDEARKLTSIDNHRNNTLKKGCGV